MLAESDAECSGHDLPRQKSEQYNINGSLSSTKIREDKNIFQLKMGGIPSSGTEVGE